MRSKVFLMGLVLACALGGLGKASPKLVVDQLVYDFGEVVEGLLVQHTFLLRNAGDAVLRFTRQPQPSCGCTTAPLTKMELAPGESLELRVKFNSSHYGGRKISHSVTVYTNDPKAEATRLFISGSVRKAAPHEGSASTLNRGFYLLLDLRSPEDYRRGHLLGAINIPFAELRERLPELPQDQAIYLYDETGELAAEAVQLLRDHNFFATYAIAGGLVGWWQALGDLFFQWAGGAQPTAPVGEPHQGAYTVPPGEVARNYLVLLDLRGPREFAQGHLPGAIEIVPADLPGWTAGLPRTLPRGVNLSIWCLDEEGIIACQAAQDLQASGFWGGQCIIGGLAQWRLLYGEGLLWSEPATQ